MLITSADILALPQFSQQECQKLNAERREIRRQLRQPYTQEQGKQLQAREQELLRLLKAHCRQPVKVPPAIEPTAA
ncbi:MAG TPA: hypothetical protein VIN66_15535 [Rheinheimera sp.]|uniref:hypothetical protein n=1 Tax=Rheinheimera sp. TaxID=1869214 RepID=UPI002F94BA02